MVGAGACRLASTHRCHECFPGLWKLHTSPDTIPCPLKDRTPPSESHCLRCPLLREPGPGPRATSVPTLVTMGESGSLLGRWPKGTHKMRGAPQRDKGASAGRGGVVIRCTESQRQKLERPWNLVWSEGHSSPGMEGGSAGNRASTHLGASVHEENSGVLLPGLHSVRLVDHAVEPHIGPRMEVKDFRGHIIGGAACRQRSPKPADTHTPLPGLPRRG